MAPRARRRQHAVVTGGAGFVGSHLCAALIRRAMAVTCVDDFSSGEPANIAQLAGKPGFRLVEADLVKHGALAALRDTDIDVVFLLASPASPADYLRRPIETLEVGSAGTVHALDLAQSAGARFVLASTSEVYGDPQQHPQRADYWGNVNPVGPRSVYDEAKRFAEALTAAYRRSRGANTAIARIFNTYGPRMRPRDGRMIPTFVMEALAGQPLTVAGDGSQTRSVCYVDDVIEGLVALADSTLPGPVNLGGTAELTVEQVARDVLRLTGASSGIRFVGLPEDDPQRRRPDTALAERELGWRPRTEWDAGRGRTIQWLKACDEAHNRAEAVGQAGASPAGTPAQAS
ncbi:NAD-dependent epimerase/dehydratase family protein [Cellulomonas timonensis]|uniref:NAD-dependent epimerase/dehydratase family protein n=1 Tax=Cellulomonas timonensis TaxID=1689271 RepID=UPI0009ED8F08|nr:NAD-dependent epimerase/dehydratase family protein [Cellulomonas timonensis]